MNKNTIRIRGAIVDTQNLKLYKEDGSTILIPQGDPRVATILAVATPMLVKQGYADVDISVVQQNNYTEFEKESNGVVRFFRIAKKKLKEMFTNHVEPTVVGDVSEKIDMMATVNEIIAHATSVTNPNFHENGLDNQAPIADDEGHTPSKHTNKNAEDTIVAIVGNKVIPGVEKIRNQFSNACKMGSTIGVENFLKRLGAVIESRSHSVEDLLMFLERADLPIADDGSILIYKVLRRKDGKYVDCHTGNVPQWVGAYVHMDPSLVDHVRNNECSNGLHVARRGYIHSFSGDVCVLAKLAPEDVITVPTYDANKMRVCGYHIIDELTPEQYSCLKANQAITSVASGSTLLAKAIKGEHIGKTHAVKVTAQRGGGVQVTELQKTTVTKPLKKVIPVQALPNQDSGLTAPAVNPLDVVAAVQTMTRKEHAQKLANNYKADPSQANYDALVAYKKVTKVSWDKLGIDEPKAFDPLALVGTTNPHTPLPAAPVKMKSLDKPTTKAKAKKPVVKRVSPPVIEEKAKGESYRDLIQKLHPLQTAEAAQTALALKKQSKKSWTVLGMTDEEAQRIIQLATQAK